VFESLQKSLGGRAALYVAAICLIILALEAWREWASRSAVLAHAREDVTGLAHAARQHAEDTFEMASAAATAVARSLDRQQPGPELFGRAAELMRSSVSASSRVVALYLFDADGGWLASSEGVPLPAEASRPLVATLAAGQGFAPMLGDPVRLAPDGRLVIPLVKGVAGAAGDMAGFVVAAVDPRHFGDFYARLGLGPRDYIALVATSGRLLAHSGGGTGPTPSDLAFAVEEAPPPSGAEVLRSPADQVDRITARSAASQFPVVVEVARSVDDVLAPWLREAMQRLAVTLLLVAALAIGGLRLADQIWRRHRSEAVLARKESEFRLLAESVSDLVERFDADGHRLYCSPALERMTGHGPDEVVGKSAFDIVLPEDRHVVKAAARRLRSGLSGEETVTYRIRHKDGRELWFETALRMAADSTPEEPSVVGVTRDVTARKLLEIRLADMARVDGLTGLANRRAFDEALHREVARAHRGHRPLSLLMIDADRFKRFNDDYGHLAGDACLRAMAAVIARHGRRPSDLAARYGGEELVILLPDTGLDAARKLGNDICRDIQALGIVHARNLPWGRATVSVGVAELQHDPATRRDGTSLVAAADLALYDAKAQGRNQCVAAPLAIRTSLLAG